MNPAEHQRQSQSPVRETVQQRLTRINLKILGIGLLAIMLIVVAAVFLSLIYSSLQAHQVRARGLAEFVVPALVFEDAPAMATSLETLHNSPDVASADILATDGKRISHYEQKGGSAMPPEAVPTREGASYDFDDFYINTPIRFENKALGNLVMRVKIQPVYRQTALLAFTIMLASAITLALVFSLLQRLQSALVRPLQDLIHVIDEVTASGNLAGRARDSEIVEIDRLAQRFNQMLELIGERDLRLAEHRDHLESEVERRTAELVAARDAAQAANRAKSEFLATMSHEIRTPLNGVYGLSELLLASGLNATQSHYADTLQQSCDHLLAVVKDILDFSKIESGSMKLEHVTLDFHRLLRESAEMIRATAIKKGLEFETQIAPGTPRLIMGDPVRIRQVLFNLLSNAVKFTHVGGVKLRAMPLATGKGGLRVEVQDTGIGIAPEAHEHIFHSFTQADGSTTRRFGGSGLGLAICKQLVERMGGEIELQSQPRRGSTFSFALPGSGEVAMSSDEPPPQVAGSEAMQRLCGSVLLAEDNEVNRTVAEAMLHSLGLEVLSVKNGQEAVERVKQQEFDLVLMDCQMPVMDGYAALRAIRALEPSRSALPIIALSANELGDAHPFDGYLGKPYHRRALAQLLGQWLPAANEALPPNAAAALPEAADRPSLNNESLKAIRAIDPDHGDALLRRVIATFLKSAEGQVLRLTEAYPLKDYSVLEKISHALSSAAGSVGADELAATCRQIEPLARAGAGQHAALGPLVKQLAGQFVRAKRELERV